MKNFIFILMVCVFVVSGGLSAHPMKIVDLPQKNTKIKPLKIGDTLPEEVWNLPLQKINGRKANQTVTLKEYKGKMIILDLWTTTCGACIAAFPKLDSLQQKYNNNEVVFLSVSTENKEDVSKFVRDYRSRFPNLNFIADGRSLTSYFEYTFIPHYVWIDGEGVFKSTSESLQVNELNINEALNGRYNFRKKLDMIVEYDFNMSLLQNVNGYEKGKALISSTLLPYQPELKAMRDRRTDSLKGVKITFLNNNLFALYTWAYSSPGQYFWKINTAMEVEDPEKLIKHGIPGQRYMDWLAAGNGYCYEIIVNYKDRDSVYKYMQADLDKLIPHYKATVESREIDCYVIKMVDEQKLLASTEKDTQIKVTFGAHEKVFNVTNTLMNRLVEDINQYGKMGINLYNETGRNDRFTMLMPRPNQDLSETNRYLAKFGLAISLEKRTKPFLVIRDRPVQSKN